MRFLMKDGTIAEEDDGLLWWLGLGESINEDIKELRNLNKKDGKK